MIRSESTRALLKRIIDSFQGAHRGDMVRHEGPNGSMICHVESDYSQLRVIPPREEAGHPFGLEVGEGDLGDFRVLKQIKGACAALKAGAEYEHFHLGKIAGNEIDE